MKNLVLLILSSILCTGVWAQDAEQAAIKKVIEDVTHYFNQRDFDNLSALWVHSPNAYYSFAGPNFNRE